MPKKKKTAKKTEPRPGQGLGRGLGRAPLEEADRRSKYLRVRCTPGEKLELEDAADRAGLTLSAYILAVALASVRQQ